MKVIHLISVNLKQARSWRCKDNSEQKRYTSLKGIRHPQAKLSVSPHSLDINKCVGAFSWRPRHCPNLTALTTAWFRVIPPSLRCQSKYFAQRELIYLIYLLITVWVVYFHIECKWLCKSTRKAWFAHVGLGTIFRCGQHSQRTPPATSLGIPTPDFLKQTRQP